MTEESRRNSPPRSGMPTLGISSFNSIDFPMTHETVSARPSPVAGLLGGYLHPHDDAACRPCLGYLILSRGADLPTVG
ncbi:hypothetical protein F1880_000337 [Penicillium rolfsii]|nr:hypothetical protein F1880_000337 [Penicillium rolfsii]